LQARSIFVLVLVSNACFGQESHTFWAKPGDHWTQASNTGLNGPVHTVKLQIQKLNEDPRSQPKLWSSVHGPWLVFDRQGRIIDNSNAPSPDGEVSGYARTEYRDDGSVIGHLSSEPGHEVLSRSETTTHPDGSTETSTFFDEKLVSRTLVRRNPERNEEEDFNYSASGELVSSSSSRSDNDGRNVDVIVTSPNSFWHMCDLYWENGIQRTELNEQGKVLWSISMQDGKLLSAWHDPDCHCAGSLGWDKHYEGGTSYGFQEDGALEEIISKHPGRYGNIENDEEERYRDGILMEKLTFEYQRDSYGNWTERTVSAWDPETNSVVPIEADTRVITYY
jgi:hypothetical protein